MTRRRYTAPRAWLAVGGQWPGGPFVAETPAYARKTAEVVARLERALSSDGRSARQIAAAANLDHGTLSRLCSGSTVPDLGTVDRLELALGADLWCGHIASSQDPGAGGNT